MFCSSCGVKISKGAKFCRNCGQKTNTKAANIEESISTKSEIKNYSPVFWKYFWVAFLLNIFSQGTETVESWGLWIIFVVLVGIYVYKFSAIINEAMLSIGKKHWWPLGLLSLIPFGFWIAFLIVRAKLKPHGRWVSKHKSFKMSKGL